MCLLQHEYRSYLSTEEGDEGDGMVFTGWLLLAAAAAADDDDDDGGDAAAATAAAAAAAGVR